MLENEINGLMKPDSEELVDYIQLFGKCFVDLSTPIPRPDVLLSIGTDSKGFPIPIATSGEFSCTVAPSKTKKTFLKSLFIASYIGGDTNLYTSHIKGHRKEDLYILDIDTEQGDFYAQRSFLRTQKLCGAEYKNYIPVHTRKLSAIERVRLTDWILRESEYAGKIKLVAIDGIADYIDDANNLVMSNEIAYYLLKWTDELKVHIHTVIHKAYGTDKATGHLGSAVTKKAETLIFIDPIVDGSGKIINYNTVYVRCGHSRGMMFDPFYMSINKEGLPFTHTEEHDTNFSLNETNENTIIERVEPIDLPKPSLSEAFEAQMKKEDSSDCPF